ncbi:GreA/GreB family elongation factor [Roseivirga sp. BDSF3-8]|uniref:GreA/GreB family elongation factor n=1 Tax=Roseivirga sp. BDSF3-8 TaxID=3241598 RepID=UPI0035318568
MSRAFVKEDDSGEPPIIPPRAALPAGATNYVTPYGLEMLRSEHTELETERNRLEVMPEKDSDARRELGIIKAKIAQLNERIGSARVVDNSGQDGDEVRFGATVELKTKEGGKPGMKRKFQIVGVDEADIKKGKIGFVAPIAKAVNGKKKGEVVELNFGRNKELAEVTSIKYK